MYHRGQKVYSVFVGHLPLDVTKHELLDLFGGCGDVIDANVLDPSKEMCYKYGFVRFDNYADAEKATKELNRWSVKGSNIVVEIANNTKLMRRTEDHKDSFLGSKAVTVEKSLMTSRNKLNTSLHLEGLKNLGHFKDSCAALNLELNDSMGGSVNMEKLFEDISEEPCTRAPACSTKLYDVDFSLQEIRDRLTTRKCDKLCTPDKQAEAFRKSLKKIVANITTFLGREEKETKEISLNREDSLGYSSQFSDSDSGQCSPKSINFSKLQESDLSSSSYCDISESGEDINFLAETRKLPVTDQSHKSTVMQEFYQKMLGRGRGIHRSYLPSSSPTSPFPSSSTPLSVLSPLSSSSPFPHMKASSVLLSQLQAKTSTSTTGLNTSTRPKSS